MKNIILKIENIDELIPSMKGYNVILSESHPDIAFERESWVNVQGYLWYNFEPAIFPELYADYFSEKLNLHQTDALALVEEWNSALSNNAINSTRFIKIIETDWATYGILATDDDDTFMILKDRALLFPDFTGIKGAGYCWGYLTNMTVLSDQVLFEQFGISPEEMAMFREQW